MKFKLVPTERRVARQFKAQKVDMMYAEDEMKRLIQLSKDKFKGQAIPAILNFDDGSGRGALTTRPIDFQEGTSFNISYYATQMLSERYASASQELKDQFLNQLYEDLAEDDGNEEEDEVDDILPERIESPRIKQKTCLSCGEDIASKMAYCPYCGESQTVRQAPEPVSIPQPENEFPTTELFDTLKQMIDAQNRLGQDKLEQTIQQKYDTQKVASIRQKEEEISHQKAAELAEAQHIYEEKQETIEASSRQRLLEATENITASCQRKMAQEIEEALSNQESKAESLLQGLSDFLESQ